MYVGNFGPLVFAVTGIGVNTFSEFTQESEGRWAIHDTINTPPVTELLGPGQDKLEMKVVFTRMLSIEPRVMYELIRKFVRDGNHFPLLLMGIPLSLNRWYCKSISATSTVFAPKDNGILWMEATLSFEEYN